MHCIVDVVFDQYRHHLNKLTISQKFPVDQKTDSIKSGRRIAPWQDTFWRGCEHARPAAPQHGTLHGLGFGVGARGICHVCEWASQQVLDTGHLRIQYGSAGLDRAMLTSIPTAASA